jgi:hypothetical protein
MDREGHPHDGSAIAWEDRPRFFIDTNKFTGKRIPRSRRISTRRATRPAAKVIDQAENVPLKIGSSGKSAKKSPGRHRSGRGEGLPFVTPVPRSIKGQAPGQRQPVCGGSAKPRQKDGPERQSGARLAMMPIRREDTAKMGKPQPASWQAFGQDKILSRIPEPRPETHMPSASDRRFRTPSQTRKLSVRKAGESGTAPLI